MDRHDLKKTWSVTDEVTGGARSIDEIQKFTKLKKTKGNEKHGYVFQLNVYFQIFLMCAYFGIEETGCIR